MVDGSQQTTDGQGREGRAPDHYWSGRQREPGRSLVSRYRIASIWRTGSAAIGL